MTRKKRRKQKHTAHCFVFTIETLTLTQKALELFEQPLQRADHHDTKVVFAEETMQQVKSKLAAMKQSVGLLCVTAFDYNEKIIITQAIRLYVFNLLSLPSDPRRARQLHQCYQIATHFAVEKL